MSNEPITIFDSSETGFDPQSDMRKFITNEEYVQEEHLSQLKHGILPYAFVKYEFTPSEQDEYNRKFLAVEASQSNGVPLETETSDDYMVFPSSPNQSFGSEKLLPGRSTFASDPEQ